jgi:hypothetical protein
MDNELLARLRAIEDKIDQLTKSIEDLRAMGVSRSKARKKKAKLPPPTPEEIVAYRQQFSRLYQSWLEGREVDVHSELEGVEPDQLRRFADANNLNVTAKMSKGRMLELISARFREKRQLHKSPVSRNGSPE